MAHFDAVNFDQVVGNRCLILKEKVEDWVQPTWGGYTILPVEIQKNQNQKSQSRTTYLTTDPALENRSTIAKDIIASQFPPVFVCELICLQFLLFFSLSQC